MKKCILIFICIVGSFHQLLALVPDSIDINSNHKYLIKLKSGDVISGYITDKNQDSIDKFFRFEMLLGTPKIYFSEISTIRYYTEIYKHQHRIFLMPTAEPISPDPFIGNIEGMFFYGGFGISQYFSMTAGRSVIPFLYDKQQISLFNIKSSLYTIDYDSLGGHFSVAVGYNRTWINDNNIIEHLYAATSFKLKKTLFTANIFYKFGGKDYYDFAIQDAVYPTYYGPGTFGVGLGVDSKFSERHNLFFIGEVWNQDIMDMRKTAFSLGIRLAEDKISFDWGILIFTRPYIIPYFSFVWTPF